MHDLPRNLGLEYCLSLVAVLLYKSVILLQDAYKTRDRTIETFLTALGR